MIEIAKHELSHAVAARVAVERLAPHLLLSAHIHMAIGQDFGVVAVSLPNRTPSETKDAIEAAMAVGPLALLPQGAALCDAPASKLLALDPPPLSDEDLDLRLKWKRPTRELRSLVRATSFVLRRLDLDRIANLLISDNTGDPIPLELFASKSLVAEALAAEDNRARLIERIPSC